jgi:site-specific recombinase XerD
MGQPLTFDKYLTPDELKETRRVLDKYRSSDPLNILALEILLYSGARATEFLGLTGVDLNRSNRSILIRGIKGSTDREIPLPDALFARLLSHSTGVAGSLFPMSYKTLQRLWHKYRPVRKKLHALRHTYAIQLYRQSKDIIAVKQCLGHKSIANTQIYTEVRYDASEIRALALTGGGS